MKLLLVFTFLALVCIARSAPASLSKDRTVVLPDEYIDIENVALDDDDDDTEDEMNSTTTTTTTTTTPATRRSTYVFPTRKRDTTPYRRPWLTQRTTSIKTTTVSVDEIDDYNEDEGFSKYFQNIRKFFKKFWEDFKKFIRNLTGYDLIKAIQQFFNQKNDD